jgi:DNA-binding NarL/FixJ family response regulator
MEKKLTAREREILNLCASGLSCKKMAEKLGVSICTVLKHRSNIFGKLGLHNGVQAQAYVLNQKIDGFSSYEFPLSF